VGALLIAVGVILGMGALAWLGANLAEGGLRLTGLLLGLVLFVFPFVLLFLVGGAYLMVRGGQEQRAYAEVEKEKKILAMVQTQGKVSLSNVALELNASMDQVKNWIYDLVGKGLFVGYIDWKTSTLYAADAGKLTTTTCPNCGGVRELVGKGVVRCPYCGAELFLPQQP
jgi:ribosomal protein S27AE